MHKRTRQRTNQVFKFLKDYQNTSEFLNTEIKELAEIHEIDLPLTTPLNSNSNAPIERFQSTIIELYCNIAKDKPRFKPEDLMIYAIITYNNRINRVTKLTPYEMLYGHIKQSFGREIKMPKTTCYLTDHYELLRKPNELVKQKLQKSLDTTNAVANLNCEEAKDMQKMKLPRYEIILEIY